MVPILTSVAAALAVLAVAWQYWALRTWKTAALVAAMAACMVAALALLPTPAGVLTVPVLAGSTLWLMLAQSDMFLTGTRRDYEQAEALRRVEREASTLLSLVGLSVSVEEAVGRLSGLMQTLDSLRLDEHWERIRALKREELSLARDLVSGGAADPEWNATQQTMIRNQANDAYFDVRRRRFGFWR